MKEWYAGLTILEQVYFWLGVIASVFLIVQIVLMCFSAFGGDLDVDGDGDIDVDVDSGVSLFTVKSLTAFFAVGSWVGLLVCALVQTKLQWVSVFAAVAAGAAAMALVVLFMKMLVKLQNDGTVRMENMVGKTATVYVSVPPARSGRGKITITAQGKFMELDAVTDDERIAVDSTVEIVATENECTVVRRHAPHGNKPAVNANEN